jgi:hypothetical protein
MKPRHQYQIVVARQLIFNRRVCEWSETKSIGRYGRGLERSTKQLQFQLIWYSRLNRNRVGVLRQRRNHYCAQVRGFLITACSLSRITNTLSRFIKQANRKCGSTRTTSKGTSSHPESGPLCGQPRCRHAQRLLRSHILAPGLHWRRFEHCGRCRRSCPASRHQ